MEKKEKIINKFIDYWQKCSNRFLSIPIYAKIILGPLILILFFTILLPLFAVFAIAYKGGKIVVDALTSIFKQGKNLAVILQMILLFLLFYFPLQAVFLSLTYFIYTLFIKFPLFAKWLVLGGSGYIILLLFVLGKETNSEIKKLLNSNELDIQQSKQIIEKESGKNSKANPLVWILSGHIPLILSGAFLLSAGFIILLLFSLTLDSLFPNLFFKAPANTVATIKDWMLFYLQEFLKVIPIEFLSPFLPKFKTHTAAKPWGNLLMIFCQTGITLMLYLSFFSIYGAYKYKIKRDLNISMADKINTEQ